MSTACMSTSVRPSNSPPSCDLRNETRGCANGGRNTSSSPSSVMSGLRAWIPDCRICQRVARGMRLLPFNLKSHGTGPLCGESHTRRAAAPTSQNCVIYAHLVVHTLFRPHSDPSAIAEPGKERCVTARRYAARRPGRLVPTPVRGLEVVGGSLHRVASEPIRGVRVSYALRCARGLGGGRASRNVCAQTVRVGEISAAGTSGHPAALVRARLGRGFGEVRVLFHRAD
ncbi:hypothetical protein C8R47DRAFT_1128976 [Mycena vitilis]|nr:hypothetical protein C8R47DRAFT_1128976 [Mycena vitilis]